MQAQSTAASPPTIRVRRMDFPFADAQIPKWWFKNNPLITHASNGLNLLFPKGEQFFIRSVKHYLDDIDDPDLLARIKGFFGQEGRHGHEHQRANKLITDHGLDIDGFLDLYER
ncbi:MAG TPA: metal-dependent hydrolase, partial [Polyangiaceae bacterium]|nr:metal-dependent hydrolase [Polyangiaceae bacterium]